MTCRHVQSMLPKHRDGDLHAKTARALESHLARCADCRREYEALQRLSELVAQYHVPEPPAAYWEDLQSSVLQQLRPRTATSSRRAAEWRTFLLRPVFAGSLAVVLAFACGIFVGRVSARPTPSPRLTVQPLPVSQVVPERPKTSLSVLRDSPAAAARGTTPASSPHQLTQPPHPSTRKPMRVREKKTLIARRTPTTPQTHLSKRQVKTHQKRSRPAPRTTPLRSETSVHSQTGDESPSEATVYMVYALEPPLLTVSSSADAAGFSGLDTSFSAGEAGVSGEVVSPVRQHLVVPLGNVGDDDENTSPDDDLSPVAEREHAPII